MTNKPKISNEKKKGDKTNEKTGILDMHLPATRATFDINTPFTQNNIIGGAFGNDLSMFKPLQPGQASLTMASKINLAKHSPTVGELYGDYFPGKREKDLTDDEITKLKEMLAMSQGNLSEKKVIEIYKKMREEEDNSSKKQKNETEKTGLNFIEEKLANGSSIVWRCGACRTIIFTFSGKDGLEKIKSCLDKFSNGTMEPCKNNKGKNHLNWFEIKENSVLCHVRWTFNDLFLKHVDNQKLIR